jgi:drug/metabolite transporter (DMT)-like permease
VKPNRLWFLYAMITVVAWGIWGAFIDTPASQKPPFPETLGYVVWAFVMIPPALVALWIVGWKVEYDAKSIFWGCVAGFLGAGGQLILFKTLRLAPAYLVFPYVALSPVVTIVMALILSRERATMKGWAGIALAVVAGVLLNVPSDFGKEPPKPDTPAAAKADGAAPDDAATAETDPAARPSDNQAKAEPASPQDTKATQSRFLWAFLASLVLLAWGIQGFAISHANKTMKAESIFFYMMLTSILLIPVALYMTDFKQEINWGINGPPLAAAIQILNSVGALLLVYAFRYGKAIIVSPLTNAGGPVVTVIIALAIAAVGHKLDWTPGTMINLVGTVIAIVATVFMAIEGEKAPIAATTDS